MAGGGIVAFADGGEAEGYAEGGIARYKDRGYVKSEWQIPPEVQAERDRMSIPYLMSELEYARSTGDPQLIGAAERQVRARMGNTKRADMSNPLYSLFSAAEAREPMIRDPLQERGEGGVRSIPPVIAGPKAENPPVSKEPPIRPKPEEKAPPKKFTVTEAESEPAKPREEEEKIKAPSPEEYAAQQLEVPAKPEFADQYSRVTEAYKAAGIDVNLYKEMRNELKEKKASFAQRRNQALGMAMIGFGFDLFGARRGQEAARLSQAGQKALMGYMGSMDKITENEDRLETLDRQIRLAENQFKMTGAESAMKRMEKLEDQRMSILGKNAELAQDAAKTRMTVAADIYRTDKNFQANMQNAAARLQAALGSNRGGFTDKQLVDLRAQMELQYGPKLREQYKDLGSQAQIDQKVAEIIDQKTIEEVDKARGIRARGNIPVPQSSGGWSVSGGVD
jgi:hypothetical protein